MNEVKPGLLEYLLGMAGLLAGLGAVIWLLWRAVRRSEDRLRLLSRWGLSLLTLPIFWMGFNSGPMVIIFGLVGGLVLALVWAPSLAAMVAKPFAALYDGGDLETEPQPFYSVAEAKRKTGKYPEAIAGIRAELAKFPQDFRGQLLLAEIQAEDLKDIPAAQATIEELLHQAGHPPKNIAYALNRLSDWHLKISGDVDATRKVLEWIPQMFPDSEAAYLATQRLAHLGQTPKGHAEAPRYVVKQTTEYLGLREDFSGLKAPPEDFEGQTTGLVKRLEECPTDNEARENLALLYGRHYRRMDLALEQLEQLLAQPGAPPRQLVHWLNLLADLQIGVAEDKEAAGRALERIMEINPEGPDAEKARLRLHYLNLELKGQKPSSTVQMGAYENNLGLKPDFVPPTQKRPH